MVVVDLACPQCGDRVRLVGMAGLEPERTWAAPCGCDVRAELVGGQVRLSAVAAGYGEVVAHTGPAAGAGLAAAYETYLQHVAHVVQSGDWHGFADVFEVDAVFHRSGEPEVRGREAIRSMIVSETTNLPGSLIERTEIVWRALDTTRGRVVQEMRHVTTDPGDGSRHYALATSVLTLGSCGSWARLDVTHSPAAYRRMFRSWARAAFRCGRVPEAAEVLARLDLAHPVV